MKLSFKQILSLTLGFTLLLVGCTKKPERPTPDLTQTGPDNSAQSNQPSGPINVSPVNSDQGGAGGLPIRTIGAGDISAANVLQTIYFDFDKSAIKASERSKLADAVKYLNANPAAHLMLEGHCDWRGTAEYNMALGDRRATSALNFLTAAGIDPSRLDHISKGSLDAIEKGTEEQMSKDRRVDLILVTGSAGAAP